MKLADIKKLKVPELRSRLKDLDLDYRGLKAELVVRLWSALEAGRGGTDEDELKLHQDQEDRPPTPAAPTPAAPSAEPGDLHATASAPPAGAGATARHQVDLSREFTDCGTQTEADTGLSTPDTGLSTPQHGPEVTPQGEGDAEDQRAQSSEEVMGRGRAFYEFKEEIRYKRLVVLWRSTHR